MALTREQMDKMIDEHFGYESRDDVEGEGWAPGFPFGIEGKGRPLKFRLLHVIEFTDDAMIKRENVWIDLAEILKQLP